VWNVAAPEHLCKILCRMDEGVNDLARLCDFGTYEYIGHYPSESGLQVQRSEGSLVSVQDAMATSPCRVSKLQTPTCAADHLVQWKQGILHESSPSLHWTFAQFMVQVLLQLLHDPWREDGQMRRDIVLDKSVECPVI